MKRTFKYALSAALVSAFAVQAFAQDNFPDTPANHWAYEAVARLKKDGILVGYPPVGNNPGLFLGSRPATRYEMAAAVFAAYTNLKNQTDGVASQIQTLTDKVSNGGVTKADLDNLKAALASTQNDVNNMKGWGDDVAALKKLTGEFQDEIKTMGGDIDSIKKTLGDYGDRISALEKRKPAVDIGGDIWMLMLGGYGTSGDYGITVDGRPTGVGRESYQNSDATSVVGATRDLTVLHELALKLSSTADGPLKWTGTVVIGNALSSFSQDSSAHGSAFYSQSEVAPQSPFAEGNEDIYVQDLAFMWDTSVMNWNMGIEAGRIGVKVSPYIFQRPNAAPYLYNNDRWGNGKWYFDGVNVAMKTGMAKVNVFGGRDNPAVGGTVGAFDQIAGMYAGQNGIPFTPGQQRPVGFWGGSRGDGNFEIDQHLGVTAGLPLGPNGDVNLAYLWLSSNDINSGEGPDRTNNKANGVNVYGGTVDFKAAGFAFNGTYSKSDIVFNNHAVVNKQNDAYDLSVNLTPKGGAMASTKANFLNAGNFTAKVGYKQINPQFAAPGDWGRIGMWWNPTDVKGAYGNFGFQVSDKTKITADVQLLGGTGNSVNVQGNSYSGLNTNDHITSFVLGLTQKLNEANSVELGYENVTWDLKDRASSSFTGGKPVEQWYDLAFNHKINDNAFFRFMWQISNYDSKNIAGFTPWAQNGYLIQGPKAQGGLLTTQLSVKF